MVKGLGCEGFRVYCLGFRVQGVKPHDGRV